MQRTNHKTSDKGKSVIHGESYMRRVPPNRTMFYTLENFVTVPSICLISQQIFNI